MANIDYKVHDLQGRIVSDGVYTEKGIDISH